MNADESAADRHLRLSAVPHKIYGQVLMPDTDKHGF